jgi:hypothetical protein
MISLFQVAPYITGEFFERNYNIRQRLDILEVRLAPIYKVNYIY